MTGRWRCWLAAELAAAVLLAGCSLPGDEETAESAERRPPVVFLVRQFNEGTANEDLLDAGREDLLPLGADIAVVTGPGLATPSPADNRISFGCVNLPVHFYEQVLSPAVKKSGAIVYVLPETRSPQEVFGSWDVTDPAAAPVASVARTRESPRTPAPAARRNRDQ